MKPRKTLRLNSWLSVNRADASCITKPLAVLHEIHREEGVFQMHVADCFSELIANVVSFSKNAVANQPQFEQVKKDILTLLQQSESRCKNGGVSMEEYDQARFMVCAWIDETILSSGWDKKQQWLKELLQRTFYNTTDAGEEVFERLNALGFQQRDVREVYYLCLSLGFKGRFIHQGDEFLLDQLKSSNLKLLLGGSTGIPSLDKGELFPDAYPSQQRDMPAQQQKSRLPLLTILLLVAPLLLFGLLFVVYHFALSGISDNFLKGVS
jgi:type VI secretion system protein ImpK